MSDQDAERVRRAARSVGSYVAIASALVISGGVGILVAVIVSTSRAEGEEHGGLRPGGGPRDDLVVDLDRVLPAVIVLGAVGVVLLSVIAWFAARRSVRPLGDALRAQRRFVADASHELRTPLTTVTSRIQLLQRRHERGEPIDDTIADLRADAATMSDVLNDLLLAAEGAAASGSDVTDVSAAVDAAVQSLGPIADDAGVTLAVAHGTPAQVAVPAVTLTRVLVALLDNAIQHSPAGASVDVATDVEDDGVAIRVTDQGAGIVGIDVERVFDRFARSAESGRRRGFGLGLSLVRDVAQRAGGTIEVERTSHQGTTFLLRLPLVD
ncbi:sensor histidine kinase [Microbacterium sp.]|uniref:sensor histidine kinase n=1 Tax=Microbacterium sp. TaxID=51671 RepID=UPI003F726225